MNHDRKPLVTIVTVVYNLLKSEREDYFHQCIKSVHDQTYPNIEHIIVDGASQDGSLAIIQKYADKGWTKYVSEPDKGIYDAMNKGIKMARGKYIAFLNSDDFYHNYHGVEVAVEALEKSQSDFSYAPVRLLNEDGSLNLTKHPSKNPNIRRAFLKTPLCHQTMFVRKDTLVKEGMFDTNYRIAADYDLIVRMCLHEFKSVLVPVEFVTYRTGGMSSNESVKNHDEVKKIYFTQFNKLCDISQEECNDICNYEYAAIPSRLAKVLKKYPAYFDFKVYTQVQKEMRQNQQSVHAKDMGRGLFERQKSRNLLLREFISKYINFIRSQFR